MILNRTLLLLAIVSLLTIGLTGCSDSDPADPGTTPDTTAPTVLGGDPSEGDTEIGQNEEINIHFSEAMDQTTAADFITLSSGTITNLTWVTDSSVRIGHTQWAEGAHITVTVNSGIADLAGNALGTTYNFSFYVYSSVLSVLETNPAHNATNVNRSTNIHILFSAEIDEGTIPGNTTITDPITKATHAFTVESEGSTIILVVTDPLPADTEITVTIGGGVLAQNQTPLGNPVEFSFTTGSDVDTTPPTILSVIPANGSIVDANSGTLQITFSEPMDPLTFNPSSINVELAMLLGQSTGVWSANNTVISITAATPMPAGSPMELTFADFADANGVVQTTPWNWEATVAGTPDYFPLYNGKQFIFAHIEEGGDTGNPPHWGPDEWTSYVQADVQPNGNVELREYDPTYSTLMDAGYEIYRKTSNAVNWLGFVDSADDPAIYFNTPLTILPLPVSAGTWTSSTTVSIPEMGTLSATLTGNVIGQFDVPTESRPGEDFFFKDTWKVAHRIEVRSGGELVEVMTDTTSYSVGNGVILFSRYDDMMGDGQWDRWEYWQVFED